MLLIDLLVQELPKHGGWPAGATRCVQDGDGTIKFDRCVSGITRMDRVWLLNGQLPNCGFKHDICDDWGFRRVYQKEYEAALKPVWDGTGVPPVGTECELYKGDFSFSDRIKDGATVKVIAHFENHGGITINAVTYSDDNGNAMCTGVITQCLRPIRTERDKFVDSVSEILCLPPWVDVKLAAVKLWNAGYRKV
jgi:hypothetical protein